MKKRTCLVTGGAGFIGSHLCEALVAQGHDVRVLDNFSSGKRQNLATIRDRIQIIPGNIRSRTDLMTAMQGVDVVYHQAALPSVTISVKDPMVNHITNINGTLNVLETARHLEVQKVIMASSAAVYGNHPAPAKDESLPTEPSSPYGLAKLNNEQYATIFHQLYGMDITCFRYFNVFGPRQNPKSQYSGVISIFVDTVLDGGQPTIYGDGNQSRDFVPVSEIVRANLLAMSPDAPSHGIYNIGLGQKHTLLDLIRVLESETGRVLTPEHKVDRRGDIRHSLADIALIQNKLGFQPVVTFEEAFRHFIRYELEQRRAAIEAADLLQAQPFEVDGLPRSESTLSTSIKKVAS